MLRAAILKTNFEMLSPIDNRFEVQLGASVDRRNLSRHLGWPTLACDRNIGQKPSSVARPMPPKVKLPAQLPKTWKYGNRNLKPALAPEAREEYRKRIITPKVEPLWSRGIQFANFAICAGSQGFLFIIDSRNTAIYYILCRLWTQSSLFYRRTFCFQCFCSC
jgi:hypothetical protein